MAAEPSSLAARPRALRRACAALAAAAVLQPAGVRGEETAAPAPAAASAPAAAAVAMPAGASPSPWTFAALPESPVEFHGIVGNDAASGKAGAILYPAFGLIGFVAAVATHAIVESGMRSHADSKAQQAADRVIDPYRAALAGFDLRDLQRRALAATPAGAAAQLRPTEEALSAELLLQAVPTFAMTADESALVLDELATTRVANAIDPPVARAIRVVSAPRRESDLRAAWNADGGAALKSAAASLVAESIDILLAQAGRPVDDKLPFRTVRYQQGRLEKMERAQVLDETCDHLLLRTLRGDLMAVPHRADAVLPAGCPAPEPLPARQEAGGFDPTGGAPPAPAAAASSAAG